MVTYMIVCMRRHARGLGGDLRDERRRRAGRGLGVEPRRHGLPRRHARGPRDRRCSCSRRSRPRRRQPARRRRSAPCSACSSPSLIGWGIYRGGVRINLARFFRITAVLLVHHRRRAAGRARVHTPTRPRCSPPASEQALDLSAIVVPQLGLGHDRRSSPACSAIYPYPSVAEVVVWLLYAVPMLAFVLWPQRARPPQRPASALDPGALMTASTVAAGAARSRPLGARRLRRQRRLVDRRRESASVGRQAPGAEDRADRQRAARPRPRTCPAGRGDVRGHQPGHARRPTRSSSRTPTGSSWASARTSPPACGSDFTLTLQPGKYVLNCTFQNDAARQRLVTVTGAADRRRRAPTTRRLDAGRRGLQAPTSRTRPASSSTQTTRVRGRAEGRRRREGQGALRPDARPLRGDRAGRRELRRPRPRDRRARQRRRRPARSGRASTASSRSCGATDTTKGTARSPTKLLADVKTLDAKVDGLEAASPRSSPTAPSSCSTRSPSRRSPARRTATRTPTCPTSRATSAAPRRRSRRSGRRSSSAATAAW